MEGIYYILKISYDPVCIVANDSYQEISLVYGYIEMWAYLLDDLSLKRYEAFYYFVVLRIFPNH